MSFALDPISPTLGKLHHMFY